MVKFRRAWVILGTVAVLAGVAAGAVAATDGDSTSSADFRTNENGQTYGTFAGRDGNAAVSKESLPDLVAVVGDNGVEGYVDVEAVTGGPEASSPEEALATQRRAYEYPVYASDGVTVVDTFTVNSPSSIPRSPPPDADK